MRNRFFLTFCSIAVLFSINSCKKGTQDPDKNDDVYVSGMYKGMSVYWKNGNLVSLTPTNNSYCGVITASGHDVYISGATIGTDNYYHAIYWKNGAVTDLGQGKAAALAVNGNDVYTVGQAYGDNNTFNAAEWKNGVLTTYGEGYLSDIAIAGNDVYIAGSVYNSQGSPMATYWKDNIPVSLGYGQINSIAISGTDVYAAGFIIDGNGTSACYWKNGVVVKLADASSSISKIVVSGGNVYVAGSTHDGNLVATYWKNGTPVTVNGASYLTGMAIAGSDIYLSGYYDQLLSGIGVGTSSSQIIENSKITTLATTDAGTTSYAPTYTTGIALVPR